jgi:hypothetical protein
MLWKSRILIGEQSSPVIHWMRKVEFWLAEGARRGCDRMAVDLQLPVQSVPIITSANQFYIYPNSTYIVFILHCQKVQKQLPNV